MQSFRDVIARWPTVAAFAREVGALERTAMSWWQRDSIPAEWFAAVVRAAVIAGFLDVTADRLMAIAELRRLAKDHQQPAVA